MTKPLHSQDCPFCANPAEYQFVDYENRKHFTCANCTEFQISVRAENRLSKAPVEWKSNLAKLAKQHKDGHTLVVTLPSGPWEEGVSYPALIDQYVLNSELPQ